jgi:hypothetical protein
MGVGVGMAFMLDILSLRILVSSQVAPTLVVSGATSGISAA